MIIQAIICLTTCRERNFIIWPKYPSVLIAGCTCIHTSVLVKGVPLVIEVASKFEILLWLFTLVIWRWLHKSGSYSQNIGSHCTVICTFTWFSYVLFLEWENQWSYKYDPINRELKNKRRKILRVPGQEKTIHWVTPENTWLFNKILEKKTPSASRMRVTPSKHH